MMQCDWWKYSAA